MISSAERVSSTGRAAISDPTASISLDAHATRRPLQRFDAGGAGPILESLLDGRIDRKMLRCREPDRERFGFSGQMDHD